MNDPAQPPAFDATLELIRRFQDGERAALDQLCERYWPRVLALVRRRVGASLRSVLDAEDIVQQTFAAALPLLDRFEIRHDAAFIQWISKVAERRILSAARAGSAQKRERGREVALDAAASDYGSTVSRNLVARDIPVTERLAQAELIELVEAALDELPPDYREVILLRDFAGGEWDFVARELARPSAEAAQELHRRARVRLTAVVGSRVREASSAD